MSTSADTSVVVKIGFSEFKPKTDEPESGNSDGPPGFVHVLQTAPRDDRGPITSGFMTVKSEFQQQQQQQRDGGDAGDSGDATDAVAWKEYIPLMPIDPAAFTATQPNDLQPSCVAGEKALYHVYLVYFSVKPACVDEFLALLLKEVKAVLESEPGMIRYDLLQQKDDVTQFLVYEICADDAAMEVHEGRRVNEKPDLRAALAKVESVSRKLLPFTGRYIVHQPAGPPGLVGWPGFFNRVAPSRGGGSGIGSSIDGSGSSTTSSPSQITLLDGGMGHQLKAMGVEISGRVGSMERFLGVAMANAENPDIVRDAHLAFIDVGAEVITTNNYAVVPACLELRENYSAGDLSELKELVAAAGKCARAACDARPERAVRVAGCLPPLHESYRADKVGSFEENLKHYKVIAASIEPYADVFLCETMSTAEEAKAAALAAYEVSGGKKPVWVSWTLDEKEPKLRSGESLGKALEVLHDAGLLDKVEAILFNCTSPEMVTKAVPLLQTHSLLPPTTAVGGYANGFVTAESGSGEYRDLSPAEYHETFASKWITSAAGRHVIVGGCCGIFPRHIGLMSERIDAVLASSPQDPSK